MIKIKTLKTKYKILTWNIRIHKNYEKRLGDIVKFIKELNPDIALLQEVDCEFLDQTVDQFKKAGYHLVLHPNAKNMEGTSAVAYDRKTFKEHRPVKRLASQIVFDATVVDLIPNDKLTIRDKAPKYVGPEDRSADTETPLDYGNDILSVISYHGSWGGIAQTVRLNEIMVIDKIAKAKGNAVILGGDFNATPNEPAIKFLTGSQAINGTSTLWVEAQDLILEMGGREPIKTSFNHGPIVDVEAKFNTHYAPERRIDYLFNYGYSYGRQYAFDGWEYQIDLDRARELSDHAPLMAGILG